MRAPKTNDSAEDGAEQRTAAPAVARAHKKGKKKPVPAKRAYHREQLKEQRTVRVDRNLSGAVDAQAKFEGLRFTDAVEEGLWLWIQKKRVTGVALRGRFLWSVIPLDLQKLVESCMIYLSRPKRSSVEDVYRKYMRDILSTYREDPDFQAGLKEMSELPAAEAD